MTYKVLSLKWRPKQFEEIVGQDHITKALCNAIKLKRIAHAFTFAGPRGVGKTSTARILASTLNEIDDISKSLDVFEMDAASNRGIDEIRNLKENINFAPSEGKFKIYIIDEIHMLSTQAFNALLKTLHRNECWPNELENVLQFQSNTQTTSTIIRSIIGRPAMWRGQ